MTDLTPEEIARGKWQQIDARTPAKWHQFFGRQVGDSAVGIATAYCPTAWYFGIEFLTGSSRGLAMCIGPLWVGIAVRQALTQPEQSNG